jgi:hypothetical protein
VLECVSKSSERLVVVAPSDGIGVMDEWISHVAIRTKYKRNISAHS